MKKKILISLVACFIAAGSFIGYNLTENTSRLDVSLADISVMAQAYGENGSGCESGEFECSSGGPGALSCSVSLTIGGTTWECDVTCDTGYYACCNRWCAKCECRST